jgi:hypothetical protein
MDPCVNCQYRENKNEATRVCMSCNKPVCDDHYYEYHSISKGKEKTYYQVCLTCMQNYMLLHGIEECLAMRNSDNHKYTIKNDFGEFVSSFIKGNNVVPLLDKVIEKIKSCDSCSKEVIIDDRKKEGFLCNMCHRRSHWSCKSTQVDDGTTFLCTGDDGIDYRRRFLRTYTNYDIMKNHPNDYYNCENYVCEDCIVLRCTELYPQDIKIAKEYETSAQYEKAIEIYESWKCSEDAGRCRKERAKMEASSIEIGSLDQSTHVSDSVIIRSNIGTSSLKKLSICPYCGEDLDFPEPPKFCPYCRKQISR